jgi:hypothetical protein
MSDLKYQTLAELYLRKASTEKYLGTLRGKVNNEEMRLSWINKYIEDKKPKLPTFGELQVGDCYRTENGEFIYMKIKDRTCNALSISSGCTFKHNDYYRVRPVSGTFVTGEQK